MRSASVGRWPFSNRLGRNDIVASATDNGWDSTETDRAIDVLTCPDDSTTKQAYELAKQYAGQSPNSGRPLSYVVPVELFPEPHQHDYPGAYTDNWRHYESGPDNHARRTHSYEKYSRGTVGTLEGEQRNRGREASHLSHGAAPPKSRRPFSPLPTRESQLSHSSMAIRTGSPKPPSAPAARPMRRQKSPNR